VRRTRRTRARETRPEPRDGDGIIARRRPTCRNDDSDRANDALRARDAGDSREETAGEGAWWCDLVNARETEGNVGGGGEEDGRDDDPRSTPAA